MAASALTSGTDIDVEFRLGHIAGLSHWRHVFLIAASRCFAEDKMHHMRSRVVALPRTLDCEIGDLQARMGSMLSLEMFVDGIGFDHPTSRKLLARHAMELLSCGVDDFDDRLSNLYDEHTENIVIESIRVEISKPYRGRSFFAAWKLLLLLSKKLPAQFLKLAEENFPKDSAFSNRMLNHLSVELPSKILVRKCVDAILSGAPSEFSADRYLDRLEGWSRGINYIPQDELKALSLEISRKDLLSIEILPVNQKSAASILLVAHNGADGSFFKQVRATAWQELEEVEKFCRNPGIATLVAFVSNICSQDLVSELMKLRWYLPWPLISVVVACSSTKDIETIIDSVNAGLFGDLSTWRDAEIDWRENGISANDIINFGNGLVKSPATASNTVSASLFRRYVVSHNTDDAARLLLAIGPLILNFSDDTARKEFLRFYQFIALGVEEKASIIDLPLARSLLNLIDTEDESISAYFISVCSSEIWLDSKCLNSINNISERLTFYGDRPINLELSDLITGYNVDVSRRGLLQIIATVFVSKNSTGDELLQLDKSAFELRADDSGFTREAIFVLNEVIGAKYEIDDALAVFISNIKEGKSCLLSSYASKDNLWSDNRIKVFASLLTEIGDADSDYYHDLLRYLRKAINSRRSTLSLPSTWVDSLHLPVDAFEGLLLKKSALHRKSGKFSGVSAHKMGPEGQVG